MDTYPGPGPVLDEGMWTGRRLAVHSGQSYNEDKEHQLVHPCPAPPPAPSPPPPATPTPEPGPPWASQPWREWRGGGVQCHGTPHWEWNGRDPSTGNAALPTPGGEQKLGLGVKGEKLVIVVTGNLSLF